MARELFIRALARARINLRSPSPAMLAQVGRPRRRQAWTRRSPRTRRDDGLKSESFGLGRWWLATMAGALEPNRQRRPWRQNRGHARSVGEFRASLRVPKASCVPRLCRNTHGSRFGLPEGRALGSPMARWHERRWSGRAPPPRPPGVLGNDSLAQAYSPFPRPSRSLKRVECLLGFSFK